MNLNASSQSNSQYQSDMVAEYHHNGKPDYMYEMCGETIRMIRTMPVSRPDYSFKNDAIPSAVWDICG